MTPEQMSAPLPGVLPGRCRHHAAVRRDRARPCAVPPALPDDGRRRDGRERVGPGQHVHHPAAGERPRGQSARRRRRRRDRRPAVAGTILVIDDEEAVRDLMQRFLTREGFGVTTASSGAEGLRLAREIMPDAITLDVMMPGLDGWAVLAALKADPDTRRHPGDHAHHAGRPEPGLRARRVRLPHQAARPRAPRGRAQEVPARPARPRRRRRRAAAPAHAADPGARGVHGHGSRERPGRARAGAGDCRPGSSCST